jgi:xanthine dehydrogenase accessory factor
MRVWETVAREHHRGIACVVVTILQVRGSVPGMLGGKVVVTAEGLVAGTVGGGRVEAKVIEEGQRLLGEDEAVCEEVVWNLQRDVGMTCGGEMRFLFEVVRPLAAWHVVIFGAGHVAKAVVGVLSGLACRVDVIDVRADWLEGLPKAGNVKVHCVSAYEDGVGLVSEKSYILCLTKGHSTDRPVLREVLRRYPAGAFLGVIGSLAKRAVLSRELREDGIEEGQLERMVCPVGLPIGSNDPAEIAISIVAQLLERRG